MTTSPSSPRKEPRFGFLLLVSFVIFSLGWIVDQTIRWTDHWQGFLCGLFHVVILGFGWCFTILPWSFLIYGLYEWRGWQRFRTHWILLPSVLILSILLGSLAFEPPTASHRFKRFAHSKLPGDLRNLRTYFAGGGIADYSDSYCFETSPIEVTRLISEMKLEQDSQTQFQAFFNNLEPSRKFDQDLSTWPGLQHYHRYEDGWFYNLYTDGSETRVYIHIGCI